MKKKYKSLFAITFAVFVLCGCTKSNKSIIRMQKLEEGIDHPTSEEELKAAIAKYQTRVADNQLADTQVGVWYKMLAVRYLDAKMYGQALEYFQKAIQFQPTNQNLYYYVGLCAGYMAKASLDYKATGAATTTEKYNYLKLAESAYLRAIELEENTVAPFTAWESSMSSNLTRAKRQFPTLKNSFPLIPAISTPCSS